MRGARGIYRLHLATATLAFGLVALAAAFVVAGSDLSPPTGAEIARACGDWLGGGGPAALFTVFVLALAAAVPALTARSLLRQLLAGRQYLRGLPAGEPIVLGGLPCRVVEVSERAAFCAGYLRPSVYLSRGLLESLDEDELGAVVAHERHHLSRRDPLRQLVARALAEGLFFLPILGRTSKRYVDLGELAADRAAVVALKDRRPLARALLKLSEHDPMAHAVAGVDPERVDYLLGDPEANRWRLPGTAAGRSALAVAILAGLVAVSILVKPAPAPALLLGAGCMIAMFGGPLALGAAAIHASRRARTAQHSLLSR